MSIENRKTVEAIQRFFWHNICICKSKQTLMKKYLILAAFAVAMVSCKDSGLNNSFIYFSEAQPTNVDAINEFPKKFVRTYTMDYSHRLIVEPKCAYIKEIETINTFKSELDSIPNLELRNNQIFDKSENKTYKTFIKGDTISFEIERLDTIFSFAENEIAKEYKSALILNKEVDGKYLTRIIKLKNIGATHTQLGTKKDFTKLKSELKIPFVAEMQENDTLHVVLTPTRAHFRKLLRKEGFEYESNYLFK